MKRVILVVIVFLGICSSGYSQRLSNNQKEKIISEITVLFEKNKKITVLSDNSALVTANGNYSLALEDGRTLTGGFAWTLVYSKLNDDWKIIHTHMSNRR